MKGLRLRPLPVIVLALALTPLFAAPAQADLAKCQKSVVTTLRKFKKTYLKANEKCLDAQNIGKIPGPCTDAGTQLKIQTTRQKVSDTIGANCTLVDLISGFPSGCGFEGFAQGVEGGCAGLPVTTPVEFANCLECWNRAELAEFLAILYASQAIAFCGGDIGETSPVCSDLDCAVPLPTSASWATRARTTASAR
jgi:hypothetical protein